MSWRGHWRIMRVDHWIKNLFVLPGVVVGLTVAEERLNTGFIPRLLLGLLTVGLTTSANYVLNEVLDAPGDRHHPRKRLRPVAACVDHQHTVCGHAATGQTTESIAYLRAEAGRTVDVETQLHRGSDLVDVLAPRA